MLYANWDIFGKEWILERSKWHESIHMAERTNALYMIMWHTRFGDGQWSRWN